MRPRDRLAERPRRGVRLAHQLQTESKLFRHLLYTEFNEFATGEIEAGQMNQGEPVPKDMKPRRAGRLIGPAVMSWQSTEVVDGRHDHQSGTCARG